MCGIAGLRTSGGSAPVDPAEATRRMDRALDRLAWRGPDGRGVVQTAGGWLVGATRLAIRDPAAGQPIARGERAVVYNGFRPDADRVLARFRDGPGAAVTRNDAEIPLCTVIAGQVPVQTAGHHAFAVVDKPADSVWIARDAHGEKPLFLAFSAGEDGGGETLLAFASTWPALEALIGTTLDPMREQEKARYFRFGWWCWPRSRGSGRSPDGVRVVEAAPGLARFGLDGRTRPAAVSPASSPSAPPVGGATAVDDVRRAVEAAARRTADAEVPVGLALSGGLDSACLAACLAGRAVSAWSFRAAGEPGDEQARAREVAARHRLAFHAVDGGPEILRALPQLVFLHGLPLGDPSVLALHALARAARNDGGVLVLLGGEGADELFGGYRRQRAARLWDALPPALRGPCAGLLRRLAARPGDAASVAWRARLLRALGPRPGGQIDYAALLEVVAPDVGAALGVGRGADCIPGRAAASPRAVDRESYLPCDLLVKADVATMAAGVEGRSPYLDPVVTALGDGGGGGDLPAALLGPSKPLLRRAFAASLPRSVLRARKRGFAVPLDRWLREDDFLPDLLRARRTRERGMWSGPGLADVLDRHRAGSLDAGHALYLVAAFECHLRAREDGGAA